MQRKRLVADRIRRVWAIVEYIAAHPGCGRRALAERFAIAERTLQADLNTIRDEMGLPLVRRGGYRFVPTADHPAPAFDLGDAYLLAQGLHSLLDSGVISAAAARTLATKLTGAFPVHLRPLLARALASVGTVRRGDDSTDVLGVLARAMQRRATVRLRYSRDPGGRLVLDAVLRPDLVVPYLAGWYVIGECQETRKTRILPLDTVAEVTLATRPTAR